MIPPPQMLARNPETEVNPGVKSFWGKKKILKDANECRFSALFSEENA